MMNTVESWQVSGEPGEVYERLLVPAIFAPWATTLVYLAAPQPDEDILDVACGTGIVARTVAQRLQGSGKVVGLDLTPGMLAVARSLDNSIEWREASAEAMPFPDAAFDCVLCQQGLQFFPNKPAALREMYRVLKPGGRLLISVWRSTRHTPGYAALEQALARHVGPEAAVLPPFALGDAQDLRSLVSGAGFRDIVIRADVKMTRFPSAEAFVRTVAAGAPSMLGALASISGEKRAALLQDVAVALRDNMDDEGLAFPLETHILSARR